MTVRGPISPRDLGVTLTPALRTAGFSSTEIDKIFIENPAAAFSVGVRAA